MVDDVCLYHARIQSIKDKYETEFNQLEGSVDQEEKQAMEDNKNQEIESLHISSVPPQRDN
jgi:hypothetical protein